MKEETEQGLDLLDACREALFDSVREQPTLAWTEAGWSARPSVSRSGQADMPGASPAARLLRFERRAGDALVVRLAGSWTLQGRLPSPEEIRRQIASGPPVRRLAFDSDGLAD